MSCRGDSANVIPERGTQFWTMSSPGATTVTVMMTGTGTPFSRVGV